jgi:hypothetical protein
MVFCSVAAVVMLECGIGCNLLHTVHTACHPNLQHHNSHNRTDSHLQWNAVWPPDDGRKDARNMLRNNWLPIKSLIAASSCSRLYLLIKDARSFEYKVYINMFRSYVSILTINVISSLIPLPCQNTKSPNKIKFVNHSPVICIFFS